MLACLSISYIDRKLCFNSEQGESHPDLYRPKPTMRPASPRPYDSCDISATVKAAIDQIKRVSSDESFRGFTMEILNGIASTFRYRTPRAKFREAVKTVMKVRANETANR